MKMYFLFGLALILLTSFSYPQKMKEKIMKNKGKLEQLEKIKLIEALELNEEIAIRFFARRNDSRKQIEYLEKKSDDLLLELENSLESEDKNLETKQKQIIAEIFKTRESIELSRYKFISSLNDILTTQQIAKLIVFEKKFRDEIRNVLLDRKPR